MWVIVRTDPIQISDVTTPPEGDTSDAAHLLKGASQTHRPERSELNAHDQVQSAASAIATEYPGELGVPLNTRSGRSGVQRAASSTHAAATVRACELDRGVGRGGGPGGPKGGGQSMGGVAQAADTTPPRSEKFSCVW